MELADVLKIVVPIIMALCGTVWATLKWTFGREDAAKDRQDKATKEYWQTVHDGLERMIAELSTRITSASTQSGEEQDRVNTRLTELEKELNAFRVQVAKEYLEREIWGQHAQSMERKLDLLRNDVNKELKELIQSIANWRNTA